MAEFDISQATREAVILLRREIAGQPERDSQGDLHFPGLEDGELKLSPRQMGIARFERSDLGAIFEQGGVPEFDSIPAGAIVYRSEDDKWFHLFDAETLLSMLPIRMPVNKPEDLPPREACAEKAGLLRFVIEEGVYYQVAKGKNNWMWQPACKCECDSGAKSIEACDMTVVEKERERRNLEDGDVAIAEQGQRNLEDRGVSVIN